MTRWIALTTVFSLLLVSPGLAQKKRKVKPNINESEEYPNLFFSPSAKAPPKPFRSIVQMEVVMKRGDAEPKVVYCNGTVVSKDGLIAAVVAAPGGKAGKRVQIQSAAVLLFDGRSSAAKLVSFEAAYGVGMFRAKGLTLPAIRLTKSPLVANRRLSWHTVFRNGRRTFLYSRPLRIHKSVYAVGETKDLCLIIDTESSSLNANRSGSALLALDGTLQALMGRQKHWNVSPKNSPPRTKTAWGVPAHVIARLVKENKSK